MRFFFMAVLAVAILSIGCSKSGSLFGVDKGYGSVDIVAMAENAPLFKTVAKKAEIVVTANDMSQSSKMLSVSDNAVRGVMNNIPSGKNRKFDMRIYDSVGAVKYRGQATSDVEADQTVTIPITLVRASGNAVINGTITEDSVTTGYQYFKFTINSTGALGGGIYGTCLVELHFMDGTSPVLSGYTLVARDTVSAWTTTGLWNGDLTASAGYAKMEAPWNMVLDMGHPATYTGMVISCWENFFYGLPTDVVVYGASASGGPWTQVGAKTWTAAYTTDTIPLFY